MRVWLAATLAGVSFAVAAFSVVSSAIMMQLSRSGSTTLSMAFSNAFYYGSAGASRLLASWFAGTECFSYMEGVLSGFPLLYLSFTVFLLVSAVLSPMLLSGQAA